MMERGEPLGPIGGYMFDVDGTLILSNRALGGYQKLPGAAEVLEALNARDIPYVALTNGSAYPPAEQAAKLRGLGLQIADHQMLTPSSVAANMMPRRGVKSALILGTPGVGHCLAEAGIELCFTGDAGAEHVDAVYVGWHPDCGMKDIEAACNAIWNGAALYVASDVPFFATASGRTMGYSHAITAAIRKLTGAPMILTGKPSLHALRFVARRLGVPMKRVAVVGDDPAVEIVMARRGGAAGFAVTTGFNKAADWAAQPAVKRPHRLLEGVGDLLKLKELGF
ncbi:MAG: HAD hydrolase-like protein [Alphaproteobacteria bacterium]|nr:HAD hydrolase-like protein [Alphaproteobacteria bacterium]MBU6473894.1 HAD hydrolase-like protein [Alphaproteobacteria bacterium]MDE2012916.1 HAD hydrolase-like protein [Alphaproteobacteria bacterium]MDE2074056.1 HAD hydrolase-like protein [Alphaproteobacteria bacterium]MDE2351874.1 HAD hydrolase-like protein [Alphaproteobacteria bacterium]